MSDETQQQVILTPGQQVVFPDGSSMTAVEYISYAINQGGLKPVGAGGHATREGLVITRQGTLKTFRQHTEHMAALAKNCKKWRSNRQEKRSNRQENSQVQCVVRPRVNIPSVAVTESDPLKRDQMELNAIAEYSHKHASITVDKLSERMDKQRQFAPKGQVNAPTCELVNAPTPELVDESTANELVNESTSEVVNAVPKGEVAKAPTTCAVVKAPTDVRALTPPTRELVDAKKLQFPLSRHPIDIKMDSLNEFELSVSGSKELQFFLEDHFKIQGTQGLGLCICEILKVHDLPKDLINDLRYLNKERVAMCHKRGSNFLRDPDKFFQTLQRVLRLINPNARIVHCQSPLERHLRRQLRIKDAEIARLKRRLSDDERRNWFDSCDRYDRGRKSYSRSDFDDEHCKSYSRSRSDSDDEHDLRGYKSYSRSDFDEVHDRNGRKSYSRSRSDSDDEHDRRGYKSYSRSDSDDEHEHCGSKRQRRE